MKEKCPVFAIVMNNLKPVTFTAVGSESQEIASLTIKPQCNTMLQEYLYISAYIESPRQLTGFFPSAFWPCCIDYISITYLITWEPQRNPIKTPGL